MSTPGFVAREAGKKGERRGRHAQVPDHLGHGAGEHARRLHKDGAAEEQGGVPRPRRKDGHSDAGRHGPGAVLEAGPRGAPRRRGRGGQQGGKGQGNQGARAGKRVAPRCVGARVPERQKNVRAGRRPRAAGPGKVPAQAGPPPRPLAEPAARPRPHARRGKVRRLGDAAARVVGYDGGPGGQPEVRGDRVARRGGRNGRVRHARRGAQRGRGGPGRVRRAGRQGWGRRRRAVDPAVQGPRPLAPRQDGRGGGGVRQGAQAGGQGAARRGPSAPGNGVPARGGRPVQGRRQVVRKGRRRGPRQRGGAHRHGPRAGGGVRPRREAGGAVLQGRDGHMPRGRVAADRPRHGAHIGRRLQGRRQAVQAGDRGFRRGRGARGARQRAGGGRGSQGGDRRVQDGHQGGNRPRRRCRGAAGPL